MNEEIKQEGKILTVGMEARYPPSMIVGKTYELKIDLKNTGKWPEPEKEEIKITLMVKSSLCSCVPRSRDIPTIVVHRFGGSYGPVEFLLTAWEAGEEKIRITLVNEHGFPVSTYHLPTIPIIEIEEPPPCCSSHCQNS